MKMRRIIAVGCLVACAAGCAGPAETTEQSGSELSDGGRTPGPGSCSGQSTAEGCPCARPGEVMSCWTGPAAERNVGACRDGTQTCNSAGEAAAQWGPCLGEVELCISGADSGSDADSGSGGTCSTPAASGCTPGGIRWCDDGSCFWGQQSCQDDGTWGDCNDTPGNAGPSACPPGNIYYDENCCEQSGQCCAHAVDGINFDSVGSCDAVDPCHVCTQLCAPGATRWCSASTSTDLPPNLGSWGQQSCSADGTWNACAQVTTKPPGCTSWDLFSGLCCSLSGQCCEQFDSESSDPISVHCPVTACDIQWGKDGGVSAKDGGSGGVQ
jgi:hypothetical protein